MSSTWSELKRRATLPRRFVVLLLWSFVLSCFPVLREHSSEKHRASKLNVWR